MRTLFLSAALLLVSSAAIADAPKSSAPDAKQMATDDCARARKQNKTCVIDMGKGEEVDGKTPTAGGSAIGIITFTRAESLIRIRRDFIAEIIKSAEDID